MSFWFWGTDEWQDEIFEMQPTLFGVQSVRICQSGKGLGRLDRHLTTRGAWLLKGGTALNP